MTHGSLRARGIFAAQIRSSYSTGIAARPVTSGCSEGISVGVNAVYNGIPTFENTTHDYDSNILPTLTVTPFPVTEGGAQVITTSRPRQSALTAPMCNGVPSSASGAASARSAFRGAEKAIAAVGVAAIVIITTTRSASLYV